MRCQNSFASILAVFGIVLMADYAVAQPQERPTPTPIEAPDRDRIKLDAGEAGDEQWETYFDQIAVRNVTKPAVYPVLPDADNANSRAVVIAPGGGYRFVSMDSEGFRVAERLAAEGYTAFVVKYRTEITPRDPADHMAELAKMFGNLGKGELPDLPPAVDDLAASVALIRARADEWNIDDGAINVIGFSAGARTLIRYLERGDDAPAVASAALIYPPMVKSVGKGARPPLFLAIAADDPLFKQGGLHMLDKLLKEENSVEFHLYSGGSHGFGMRPMGTTSDNWIDHYVSWLNWASGTSAAGEEK